MVDLINLVSLRTGHSIGGFDADKIQGNRLELGIGKAEEPFEGIGRGVLNIEGPVSYTHLVQYTLPSPSIRHGWQPLRACTGI